MTGRDDFSVATSTTRTIPAFWPTRSWTSWTAIYAEKAEQLGETS